MKLFKLSLLLIMFSLVFNACDEDTVTDPIEDVLGVPGAASGLMAKSDSDTEVSIKWTASPDEDSTFFKDYAVYVDGDLDQAVAKGTVMATIGDLTEGEYYTLEVRARNTDDDESAGITIEWSPATRFGEPTPMKMYSAASTSFGSGIDLYNPTTGQAETYMVADIDKWNIGINDKDIDNGNLYFETGTKITLGSGGTTTSEASYVIPGVNSLDEWWDSEALDILADNDEFGPVSYNMLEQEDEGGMLFLMRVQEDPDVDEYNYAKVLLLRGDGGEWFQGSGNDKYLECVISYQMVADTPYAKTR